MELKELLLYKQEEERIKKVLDTLNAMIKNKKVLIEIYSNSNTISDKSICDKLKGCINGLQEAIWLLLDDEYLEAQHSIFFEEDE